jgi:L,D-transpeptidase catalytic domain/Putative peptidoglycan binding domain
VLRRLLRVVAFTACAFALAPASALAADAITLRAGRDAVRYGRSFVLRGAVSPAVAGEPVGIYAQRGSGWSLVKTAKTNTRGAVSYAATARTHRVFVARGTDAYGGAVESEPVSVAVRPYLVTTVLGSRVLAGRLVVFGRLLPRTAGTLTLTEGDRTWPLRVGRAGRFRAQLTTTRLFRYRAVVGVRPSTGYLRRQRAYVIRVRVPPLSVGARGPAVRLLERTLTHAAHYALPGVDGVYDYGTSDAVLAFQAVHGLPRTGSVDTGFWQKLQATGPPRARIPSGDHVEVDKTRQLLFEVRDGVVVSVTRVSTGATGNTPVGHFSVYSKAPGFNAKGMYDSLFFTGEFAIHGYASVPTYPASHGCVRTPLWFAPGFYARWGVGTDVYVFP